MVLQTETYQFDEEVQRLEDKLSELDDVLGEMDADHAARGELSELRDSLQTQRNGVEWARDNAADMLPAWERDADAITLAGLDGGDVAEIQDTLDAEAGEGATRVEFVAAGSIHPADDGLAARIDVPEPAPYVDPGQSETDRLGVVSGLPFPFQEWARQRIDELTTLSGNGRLDSGAFAEELQTILATMSSSTT